MPGGPKVAGNCVPYWDLVRWRFEDTLFKASGRWESRVNGRRGRVDVLRLCSPRVAVLTEV